MRLNFFIVISVLISASCGDITYSGSGNDVPTAGEIDMAVDYGDSFAINEEIEMFHLNYPKAKIRAVHLCENEIMRLLEADSFRCAITNRDFTPEERENLEKLGMKVRSYEIAKTSIALVVSKQSKLDSITLLQVKALLENRESQITQDGYFGFVPVFDEGCGANLRFFSNLWFKGRIPPGKLLQKSTPREVLSYISGHDNAIGFIGSNWLSDRTDPESVKLAGQVKVLAVENSEKGGCFLPFQSQIAAKQYPFVHRVFMHDLQGYSGLATGFIAFVASQPGQIILKKSGLLPAHDMGRTIELVNE